MFFFFSWTWTTLWSFVFMFSVGWTVEVSQPLDHMICDPDSSFSCSSSLGFATLEKKEKSFLWMSGVTHGQPLGVWSRFATQWGLVELDPASFLFLLCLLLSVFTPPGRPRSFRSVAAKTTASFLHKRWLSGLWGAGLWMGCLCERRRRRRLGSGWRWLPLAVVFKQTGAAEGSTLFPRSSQRGQRWPFDSRPRPPGRCL